MKKLSFLIVSLLFAVSGFAQNTRKDDVALSTVNGFLSGIPNASIRVCQNGATGIPCTPLANIFSSVSGGALTNPFNADGNGNYFFYAPAGNYVIQVTSPFGSTYTQNDVTLPNLPSVVTTTFVFQSVPFSTTPAFSFVSNSMFQLILTGNVTSSSVTGSPSPGAFSAYSVCQDGFGGHTFTFPPNFVLPPNFVFLTGAGQCNNFTALFDGTNWQVISGGGGSGVVPASPAFSLQKANSLLNGLSASSITDNGVTVSVGEDSSFVGPNPGVYITAKGARAVNPNAIPATVGITANCNSVTNPTQVTLSMSGGLQNNDGLVLYGCGATQSMSTPTAPTVSPALAFTGTGTGIITTSVPNGGVTSNYKIIARDKNGGMTSASSAGTTTVGNALGEHTVNITSWSRTNDAMTATTASAHGFLPGCDFFHCGEVFLSGGNGLTDTSFAGWYPVSSVADSTHFTIAVTPFDTRNGASSSATGGTATWYNANHLTWSAVTGSPAAWEYYIYCDRTNSGTFTLCGVSRPQGVNTDLTWDDFGSPMMDNFAFPPYVPTVPPASATSDHLSTTITAGGGTTAITVASPALTTVTGATARIDACPGFVAAAQAINANGSHGGTLVIPSTNGNQFVVNSYCDLTPYHVTIDQRGPLYLNDTLATKAQWYGDREPQFGSQTAAGTWQGSSIISVNTANPGIYNPQQFGTILQGITLSNSSVGNNGALLALYEGGFNMSFIGDSFGTGSGNNDTMGIGLYLRGNTGQSVTNVIIDRTLFSAGNPIDAASHTPELLCNLCGTMNVRSAYYLHRGALLNAVQSGGGFLIDHSYMNGGGQPAYTLTGGSSNIGALIKNIFLDTIAHPCLAVFSPSSVNFLNGPCAPSSGIPPVTGLRPNLMQGISSLTTTNSTFQIQNRNSEGIICQGGASDGIFGASQTGGYCVNANDMALATGKNYPIFVNGTTPAAPTGSVSAGGSVAVGTWIFFLVPIWQNGGEGVYSQQSAQQITTIGNQTITLSWPNPAVPGNPKGYNLYWCNTSPSNGCAQSTTFSNPQSATSTGITLTTAFDTGAGASNGLAVPTGGPTMMMPGLQGMVSPAFVISSASGNGFTSTLSGTFAANRSITFPDASGTPALINIPQTWTANQFIANSSAIRFFSPNGVNWTALTGPGTNPSSNVTFQLPSSDSTGVQCLSSNGSGVLAFSACSAGTGTPGGSTKNLQFFAAGPTFGGASNLNYTSATGVLDLSQLANGNETITGHRFTDTSPTGNLLHFQNAALSTDLLKLDANGNLSAVSFVSLTANPAATGVIRLANSDSLSFRNSANSGDCSLGITNPGNSIVAGCAGGFSAQVFQSSNGNQALSGTVRFNTADSLNFRNNLNTADINGISKNSSDVVILGGAAGINASSLTLTSPLALSQGGTGQTSASAAFNAIAPATSTGGLIIGTGINAYGNLAIGTNGLCLVSNGTTATWNSCASGAVGGTAVAGQGAFWSAASSIAGSPNWTYSASSGHSIIQGANAADALYMKRFTDTSPSGNFIHFQNSSGSTDIAKLDVNGNMTVGGSYSVTNSSVAGNVNLNQGPTPNLIANYISLVAPTAVSASGEIFLFPGTASTGFIRWTNNANVLTGAFAPASGIGACVNTVVTATNDNTPPTCNPVTGPMFGTQAANQVWASPNGSSGTMTVRSLVSGDIPPINLNLGGNGGITGTLPIANGGTNATSAVSAFNNLSPMTTAGDIIYGGTSGSGTRLAAGTVNQVLHSGTTPSWSAVSLTADVSGVLPIASGGTNATGTNISSTNGAVYFDGTRLVTTPTGGAGTLCLTSVSGAAPTFGSCSGTASTSWSSLTNPSANLSLSMGANTTTFTWGAATGSGVDMFKITDTASNTGTGFAVNINLASGSAAKPFQAAVNGNGVSVSNAGVLAHVGTGSITADTLNLSVNTSSPLSGGGALTSNLTLNCPTCVTSGASIPNNTVVIGSGGGQGVSNVTSDSTTTHALFATAGAPAFRAIAVGDIPTLNQNTTGTAANLSGTPALPNGTTCTTQAAGDSSGDCASDSFVATAVSNGVTGSNPAVAVLAATTGSNLTGTYTQVGGGVGDTFTITATGAFTLDGVAINTVGQRVLIKDQSTASQNGVYTATTIGATGISPVFTRAADYNVPANVNNTGIVPVQSGTVNISTSWLLTSQVTSIGSSGSSLTYTQFTINPTSLVTAASTLSSNVPAIGAGSKTLSAGYTFTPGTVTSGHLACYTASGTVGNCTSLSSILGVFNSSTTWTSSGETSVVLDATVNVTFGDNLCASPTSFGTAHDNGAVACTTGLGIGIVKTTASSVTTATAFVALR